jgi:hypothetical protein
MIIKGIRNLSSDPKTLTKPLMYNKERIRDLLDFLHRLKDQMKKHSGLNLDDPPGTGNAKNCNL